MNVFQKIFFTLILLIIFCLGLILSNFTGFVHFTANKVVTVLLQNILNTQFLRLSFVVGYTAEIIVAVLIMLTPFSAVAATWFLKIAYELTFGVNKDVNVFVINPALNWIVSIMLLILALYSLFLQIQWIKKLTSPLPFKSDNKDLTRLI